MEQNPHQVAPGEPTGCGLAPTEGSVAEEPLQGAAGAVGDKAPRGRGRELKLAGTTSWPSSLPPAGAPTPGLLLGNLLRGWGWGAWNLGWGSMTPHGYQHGNQVTVGGVQPQAPEVAR